VYYRYIVTAVTLTSQEQALSHTEHPIKLSTSIG